MLSVVVVVVVVVVAVVVVVVVVAVVVVAVVAATLHQNVTPTAVRTNYVINKILLEHGH